MIRQTLYLQRWHGYWRVRAAEIKTLYERGEFTAASCWGPRRRSGDLRAGLEAASGVSSAARPEAGRFREPR